MKHKFALFFRPVVIETVEEEEEEAAAKILVSSSCVAKRRINIRSLSFSTAAPSSRHDLRRGNSSSRKTLSAAIKSLLFRSSPRLAMVPKATKEGDDHMGNIDIEKIKEKKETISNASSSPSNSLISSSTYVTSPSTSTSTSTSTCSSMTSLEMNNMKAISLKRSLLARSSSTSIHHNNKKLKTTKAKDKALNSSTNQEGFVFYLLLLALVLNLLCGFVYAVMFTSLSLYFLGLHRRQQLEDAAVKLPEIGKSRRTMGYK